MSTCRWDRDAKDYLADGKPCRRDSYGDPTKHCTMVRHKQRCANHVGATELTCARCLGRVRSTIRRIVDLAALMPAAGVDGGVNSEAVVLAGPAADYETFSARRRIDKRWIEAHIPERNLVRAVTNLLPDDDEEHPYSVLTRWEAMLREDYHDPRTTPTSTSEAADYLLRILHRVAQDDEQDFPLLANDMRACRDHLEAVLRNSGAPERGAPCPACIEASEDNKGPRLKRSYGHWCEDEDCDRMHYSVVLDGATGEPLPDTTADVWTCPRDKAHWWSHADYRRWVDTWHEDIAG